MSQEEFDYGPFQVGDHVELHGLPAWSGQFNGCETTIVGPLKMMDGFEQFEIDLPGAREHASQRVYVEPRFLRRRRPRDTGWQKVRAMFNAPAVDRRQPATAWMAQGDTADVLMTMGVRVRPGEWPVEGV